MKSPNDTWSPSVMHGAEPVTPGSGPEIIRMRETGLGIYTNDDLTIGDRLALMCAVAVSAPNPQLPTDNQHKD